MGITAVRLAAGSTRLGTLWDENQLAQWNDCIDAQAEHTRNITSPQGHQLLAERGVTWGLLGSDLSTPSRLDLWTEEGLWIAEAVRKGIRAISVPRKDEESLGDYRRRVRRLRCRYTVVTFQEEPAREDDVLDSALLSIQASHDRDTAIDAAELAGTAPPPSQGGYVHQWLDRYKQWVAANHKAEFCLKEQECTERLKRSLQDVAISNLGYNQIENAANYWKQRPPSLKSGKPIAVTTVTNHIKVLRRFLKWLDRNNEAVWQYQPAFDHALKVSAKKLRTPDEKARLACGPQTWTIDELKTLHMVRFWPWVA